MVNFNRIGHVNSGARLPLAAGRPFSITYTKHPIKILAGHTEFHIVKNHNPRYATPFLLVQPERFMDSNGNNGYKGLWEGKLVTIGRGAEYASRFEYDPTVSRCHFSIIRKGNDFTIVDNNSTNGTIIELMEGSQSIKKRKFSSEALFENKDLCGPVRQNVLKIFSDEFRDVTLFESMGGNAGPGHVGVNGCADKDGNIIYFENYQSLPKDIRNKLDKGELFGFIIKVKCYKKYDGPDFEIMFYNRNKSFLAAQDILIKTIDEANKWDNPYKTNIGEE